MTKRWLLCATTAAMLIATPALAANDAAQGGDGAQSSNTDKGTNGAQQAIDNALKDRNAPDAAAGATTEQGTDKAAEGDGSAVDARADRPKGQRAMAQRRLRQALKEAGFTDVRILGATYRIRARDEDGNTVFLRINPRAMDRHAMNKRDMSQHDMDRGGMGQQGTDEQGADEQDMHGRGMADDGDDMGSDDTNRGAMDHADMNGGMDQRGMNHGAMAGETTGEGGKARGAGPMERGGAGGYGGRNRPGDREAFAYERAYDQGFRDGYNRAFGRAHGWR